MNRQNMPPEVRTRRGGLVMWEMELLERMEMDPDALARNLGGRPFAIICAKGRMRRYRRMADYLGLQLFENPHRVRRQDGCVIIHAGEASQWLPQFRATSGEREE